jgi:hypothetical protein
MPTVEWVGQSLRDDDNVQANTSRLLNLYRERHGDKFILKSVLGTSVLIDMPSVFIRAMAEIGGQLYVANGGKVYRITGGSGETAPYKRIGGEWLPLPSGGLVVSTLGDGFVLEDDGQPITYRVGGDVASEAIADINDAADTTLAGNNGAITVAAGGEYYNIAADGTVTTPSNGAFESIGSVSFIGQRTVVTEKDGRRFGWSDVADSTTFDALNFATAEYQDDKIIRGLAIGPQYWIFSERSIEQWYLSGSANTSEFLLPVSGAAIDIGLKAFGLISAFPNGAFFVGSDGVVYLVSGGTMQPISTRGVETAIAQSTPTNCFFHEDEGHKICTIRFKDRPAWCFDISNNEWHERSEGGDFGAWTATASAKAGKYHFVGSNSGQIRRLERSNRDANKPLFRRAVSTTLENEGQRFSINRLQMQIASGTAAADGRAPEMMLRMSKDRGQTWGKERWRDTGALGDYDKLLTLRALGQFRRATLEATMSDPADVPMESTAFLEVS